MSRFFRKVGSRFFKMASTVGIFTLLSTSISTHAQERTFTLQANITFQDEKQNTYTTSSTPFILRKERVVRVAIKAISEQNANIEYGQSHIFKISAENQGNAEERVTLMFTSPSPQDDGSLKEATLFIDINQDNKKDEEDIIIHHESYTDNFHSSSPDFIFLPSGTTKDNLMLMVKTTKDQNPISQKEFEFQLSGFVGEPEEAVSISYPNPEDKNLRFLLTVNPAITGLGGDEKKVDLMVDTTGADPFRKDTPDNNAHAFNIDLPVYSKEALGGHMEFKLRFENLTEETITYNFIAHTNLNTHATLPSRWLIRIMHNGHQAEEVPVEAGSSVELNVQVDNEWESDQVWEYQQIDGAQNIGYDRNKDLLLEQGIIFSAIPSDTRDERGNILTHDSTKVDHVLVSIEPERRISRLHADPNTRNVLHGSSPSTEISFQNTGNTILSNAFIRAESDESLITVVESVLNGKAFPNNESISLGQAFYPGEEGNIHIDFKVEKLSDDDLTGRYLSTHLSLKTNIQIQPVVEHQYLVVWPRIDIEQGAYPYDCTIQNIPTPSNTRSLQRQDMVEEGQCLLITQTLTNRTNHEFQPEAINLDFQLPEGLEFLSVANRVFTGYSSFVNLNNSYLEELSVDSDQTLKINVSDVLQKKLGSKTFENLGDELQFHILTEVKSSLEARDIFTRELPSHGTAPLLPREHSDMGVAVAAPEFRPDTTSRN